MFRKIIYSVLTDIALIKKMQEEKIEADKLWHEFLNRFSKLILKIIWQYDNDYDKVMEKYLYVSQKLSGDNFALIKKFKIERPENTPKFSTWLVTVTKNLCIDSYRSESGRKRLPKAITKLSPLEQLIFGQYFWKGMSIEEINYSINSTGANGDINVHEIIDKIENVLCTSRDDILAKKMKPTFVSIDDSHSIYDITEDDFDIESKYENWIHNLPTQEKLVIRLKFWEDLSIKEIAKHLEIESEQKVYQILRNGLKALRNFALKEN